MIIGFILVIQGHV